MENIRKAVLPLLEKVKSNHEFECVFTSYKADDSNLKLPVQRFVNVLHHSIKLKDIHREVTETLDISYNIHNTDILRLTVVGSKAINSIVNTFSTKPPAVLFSILVGRVTQNDGKSNSSSVPPTPDAMFKDKERYRSDVYEDQEFGLRFRMATEKQATKEMLEKFLVPSGLDSHRVTFRFKHRVSLKLYFDKTATVRLDMTSVRQSKLLSQLGKTLSTYEIELDMTADAVPSKSATKTFFDYIPRVVGWIQNVSPEYIVGTTKTKLVLDYYHSLVKCDRFYQMKPVSLDIERFIDILPNNYSVTDKADGSTACLVLMEGEVFLVNNNLEVIQPGVKSTLRKAVVAEGELIEGKDGRSYLLLYDCLIFDGNDIQRSPLLNRVKCIDAFIETLPGGKKNIPPEEFHLFSKHLQALPETPIRITRKLHLFPKGLRKTEIYELAETMWNDVSGLPYNRDGLIFTGVEQPYTMDSRETRYPIFKWKPPEQNSIDFYVEFMKKRDGSTDILFDKTAGVFPEDRPFITLRLFVGRRRGGREFPVPFLEKEGKNRAIVYISKDDPVPRDAEGHPINDGTVVEMVYDYNSTGTSESRWRILRTRFDKTQSVHTTKTKYGNNEDVSMKVWETIINPININDFHGMALDKDKYASSLRTRFLSSSHKSGQPVANSNEESTINDEAYYQFQSDAGRNMRRFHNSIKDTLISYFSPKKELGTPTPKRQSILDIGVGRGGDIHKMWNARVKELIGIDPDENGLFKAADCAKNRYRDALSKHPGYPPMTFIQADASIPFYHLEGQHTRFPYMTAENKSALKKVFGSSKTRFQGINAQFMIHYLFTEHGMSGLCKNIERFLCEDGIMLVTCFNADRIIKFLDGKQERSVMYIDNNGEEQPFFTIRSISIDSSKPGLDQAIDVFVSLYMSPGTFYTEYLVYPETLVDELGKRSDMVLIDRCSFESFLSVSELYSGENFFDVSNSELDRASKELTNLYEIYIFQKKSLPE